MIRHQRIGIDPLRPLATQPDRGHNRWHEAIPPALEVEPGQPVALETWDAFDAQLTPTRRSRTWRKPTSAGSIP